MKSEDDIKNDVDEGEEEKSESHLQAPTFSNKKKNPRAARRRASAARATDLHKF